VKAETMNDFLPSFMILAMAFFVIAGFWRRKRELTASDRRTIALAVIGCLILPVVMALFRMNR